MRQDDETTTGDPCPILSTPRRSSHPRSGDRLIRTVDGPRYAIGSPSRDEKESSPFLKKLQDSLLKAGSPRQFSLERSARTEKKRDKPQQQRTMRVQNWRDNFYSSLLDWSSSNWIYAGSGEEILQYNMVLEESQPPRSCAPVSSQPLSSLRCSNTSSRLALGYSGGLLRVFDCSRQQVIHQSNSHLQRIAALDWHQQLLLTGSKDKSILAHDLRMSSTPLRFNFHTQEVCGLRQRGNLIASGGNDNAVIVFDIRYPRKVVHAYRHLAAVRALQWLPSGELVSGGGTADRTLRFWSEEKGMRLSVDTGSQVCAISVSPTSSQLISCQGFSLNQIILWDLHGNRLSTIHAHQSRVLYCARSPDGTKVATGAGDKSLRVWKMFPPLPSSSVLTSTDCR